MPTNTNITRCSCDRSNCHIEIVPMLDTNAKNKETKFDIDSRNMFQRFNQPDRPQTIIFVISKREAVNLCNALQSLCDPTTHVQAQDIAFFHADLDKGERTDRMKGFGTKALTVIVATTAFGTGVNYPNIRIILHYTIPPTLVELSQNIGRGGRDGQPYQCIMYYSYKGILECGGVWAQGAGFDSEYWARYIEVVKYILSTKCRKAYIVPFFDTAFEPGTACLKCDNCRLAEVSMTIDIGRVAVIILQVVKEFSTPSAGILFSTLRDIVTCGGLSAKQRSDGALKHPLRGIGARQGYTA
jgi:superfamily II DNA helicase RecQ